MSITSDNGLITVGIFRQQADFDPSASTLSRDSKGSNDIFIAKYDVNGSLVWVKTIGGTGDEQVTSVFLDNVGDVIITGSFTGQCDFDPSGVNNIKLSKGMTDAFVAKYTSGGDLDWVVAFGGPSNDVANDCFADIIGSISVIGSFNGSIDVEPTDPPDAGDTYASNGMSDIFLIVYSDEGVYETGFTWGGTANDEGTSVNVDSDLNFIIAGFFNSTIDFDTGVNELLLTSSGMNDAFISKYDLIGNIWWAFKIGGTGDDKIVRNCLVTDEMNNIFLTGYYSNTSNFDPNGTANLTSKGKSDIFIAKYDEDGKYVWANSIGNTSDDMPYSINLDNNSNIYLNGSFTGTVDIDPSVKLVQLTTLNSGIGGFFAKYDKSCTYQWANAFGNSAQTTGAVHFAAATLPNDKGDIYSAGTFTPMALFYNDLQSEKGNGSASPECYIALLDKDGKFKSDIVTKTITVVYPNGGEVLNGEMDININFTAANIDTFNINYSNDGTTFTRIFSNVTLSQLPIKWKVPNAPSKTCLIEVVGVNDRTIADRSNNYFEIVFSPKPVLNLVKPNGGELLMANSNYDITWQSFNLNEVDIYFSLDKGFNWELITSKYPASIGKYAWTVKDINSTQCFIKMLNSANNTEMDRSQSTFTIQNEADVDADGEYDLVLMPIPANDKIQFKANATIKTIRIIDLSGNTRLMNNGPFASCQIEIDLTGFESGLYFLSADTGTRKIIRKIIKSTH
jgi:hypothetical protein